MRNSIASLRLSVLTLALATSLTVPLRAHAQTPDPPKAPNPQITLHLQDSDLKTAFEQIFKAAKVNYTIDPSVKGIVTASISGTPLRQALDLMVRTVNPPLTYRYEDGVYSILPKEAVQAEAQPDAPKQEISVKAEIVLMAGKGEKMSKGVVSMLGRAPNAGTIKLQTTTDSKPGADKSLAVSAGDYDVTIKPTFNSDGSIQISAEVALDINYRLPGDAGFQHLKTKLSGSGRYRAGDTMVFSSTVLKSQDDKAPNNTAELLIFLTPTITPPRVAPQPVPNGDPKASAASHTGLHLTSAR